VAYCHVLTKVLTATSSGTKRIKYLEENIESLNVKLTALENKRLREEIEAVEVTGDRYPPFFAAYCFADTPPL
jgi:aryl-alcohol dehydrogenase-like predicted oxidoreductase